MTQKQPYIADGFMDDCEELISNLTKKFDKVDWHKFCYVWKEMEFDLLFYGRQSGSEVVEFTEEVLQVARLFLVTKTNTFESQVIGLFIAYTITLIQPYKDLCALRLIPVDASVLEKFEAEVRREKRYDVLMILARMYFQGRMEFHVALRERAMDTSIRKYFDGTINVPYAIEKRWLGELNRDRIKALEDIAQEEMTYVKLKKQAMLATKALNPGVKLQPDVFRPAAKQMAESLRKLTTVVKEPTGVDDSETAASQIKKKAMKNMVDPMKHLHGLDDRKKEKEKVTISEPELKSPKPRKRSKRAKPKEPTPEPELIPPDKTYSKLSSEANKAFSLPSLDDPSLEGSSLKSSLIDPPAKKENLKLGGSKVQFQGFKGFTIEEIQSSDYNKLCAPKAVNKPTENDESKLKPTPDKTSTNKTNATKNPKNKVQEPIPGCSGTRKKTPSDQNKKKKKKWTYKNKLNKKLRLASNFDNSDSDTSTSTDIVYTSDEDKPHTKLIEDAETCKGKELTIQSKGVVKHFVEYEVDENIVIRTEKDAPPTKDIEIEYIDNFTEANAYEEVCELSDEETKKDNTGKAVDKAEISKATEECDGDDDLVEVFQIISDAELDINQPSTSSEGFSSVFKRQEADDALEKILENKNRAMDRRLLARPNLRSKFKKMGLLDFANLEYGKNEEFNSDSD